MAYQKQTWENLPSQNTPITAERLNHIEDGIEEAYEHGGGGETLPVGSEIDFDGTSQDIPTGWEEIDNPEEYSTSEVFTGKYWIDGKPIYRKTISYNDAALGMFPTIPHGVSNIGEHRVVIEEAYIYGGNTFCGYKDGDEYVDVMNIDGTNINISIGSSWSGIFTKAFITIEYTKTTD